MQVQCTVMTSTSLLGLLEVPVMLPIVSASAAVLGTCSARFLVFPRPAFIFMQGANFTDNSFTRIFCKLSNGNFEKKRNNQQNVHVPEAKASFSS